MADKGKLANNMPLVVVAVVAAVLGLLIWLSMGLQPNGAGSSATISNEELVELVEGGALLVDVRTQSEFEAGHIEGAVLAPVDQVARLAEDWDRDTPVVLYCATGARSSDAAKALQSMGFDVYDLTAGIISWTGALSTAPSAQPPTGGGSDTAAEGPVMYEFLTDS